MLEDKHQQKYHSGPEMTAVRTKMSPWLAEPAPQSTDK